ncbi:MAG: T9SS type A sorting domain-containing protein [Flavobacteriales bacterium]|nr:T9SS type A sorting domain-containing protein [Flavobacteriales bacterium]
MKKALFCIFTGLLYSMVQGQASIEWEISSGGSLADNASSVSKTGDGGYFITGYTFSTNKDVTGNHGNSDLWVVKLDQAGEMEWQKCLGGTKGEIGRYGEQTSDEGYIVTGNSLSSDGDLSENKGSNDFWIVKLKKNGSLEWQKTYGGSGHDYPYQIKQTFEGGYILVGHSYSEDGDLDKNKGEYDAWVLKLNETGDLEWKTSLGGAMDDILTNIVQTNDSMYIASGLSKSNDGDLSTNKGGEDVWLVKLDRNGTLISSTSFGGTGDEYSNKVLETEDKGFLLACRTSSNDGDITSNKGQKDFWILKLNQNGQIVWQRSYGGSFDDYPYSVEKDFHGGYYVSGYTGSNDGNVNGNNGGIDVWLLNIAEDGTLKWQKTFGGSGSDIAYSMVSNTDGSVVMTGSSTSKDKDVSANNGALDYWTLKVNTVLSVKDPQGSTRASLYPNPTSDKIEILFMDNSGNTDFKIYDLQGRLMMSGDLEVVKKSIDVSNLQEGLYYLSFQDRGAARSLKFLKL